MLHRSVDTAVRSGRSGRFVKENYRYGLLTPVRLKPVTRIEHSDDFRRPTILAQYELQANLHTALDHECIIGQGKQSPAKINGLSFRPVIKLTLFVCHLAGSVVSSQSVQIVFGQRDWLIQGLNVIQTPLRGRGVGFFILRPIPALFVRIPGLGQITALSQETAQVVEDLSGIGVLPYLKQIQRLGFLPKAPHH